MLALLLSVERQLFTSIITMCSDEHGHLDVLQVSLFVKLDIVLPANSESEGVIL